MYIEVLFIGTLWNQSLYILCSELCADAVKILSLFTLNKIKKYRKTRNWCHCEVYTQFNFVFVLEHIFNIYGKILGLVLVKNFSN